MDLNYFGKIATDKICVRVYIASFQVQVDEFIGEIYKDGVMK